MPGGSVRWVPNDNPPYPLQEGGKDRDHPGSQVSHHLHFRTNPARCRAGGPVKLLEECAGGVLGNAVDDLLFSGLG